MSALLTDLAGDLAAALDPVVLARRAGIDPDPWQADVLRSDSPRLLLNCSRQSGKSTIVSAVAVHQALTVPGSLTLMVSPTLRQSGELFRKARAIYRAIGRPVPAESETALTLTLANASRIVSLPGKDTVRGYSGAALLIVDEASRVEDELYLSVRPMLAVSRGRLIALSTPHGMRGWWYEAWIGAEDWQRIEVPATGCRRITPGFLAEERRTLGNWWFAQEYECQFLDSETAAFARADVDAAFAEGIELWDV